MTIDLFNNHHVDSAIISDGYLFIRYRRSQADTYVSLRTSSFADAKLQGTHRAALPDTVPRFL
jgi:hypothetical protein